MSQSYLRGFATDDARQKIWRFGKTVGAPELKPIEKVAVKFHLYAPRNENVVRDDSLEKKLANLENWLGTPIWGAVCNDFPDLRWEPLRKMVALLMATMYLRNPLRFDQMKLLYHEMVGLILRAKQIPPKVEIKGKVYAIDPTGWPAFRDADEDYLKRHWNQEVSQAGWLAEHFLRMRWAVLVSETPVFITSDDPVLLLHPSLRFKGLKNPETSVIFPLSPTRVLTLDHRRDQLDGMFYPLKHDPASLNGLIWRHSIEHMFSPRHPDVVCAEILADAERMGFA